MDRLERKYRQTINEKPTKQGLLMFADWLEEEVDCDRAEAIRCLVEKNQLPIRRFDNLAWGKFGCWYPTFCEALDVWVDLWLKKESGELT